MKQEELKFQDVNIAKRIWKHRKASEHIDANNELYLSVLGFDSLFLVAYRHPVPLTFLDIYNMCINNYASAAYLV